MSSCPRVREELDRFQFEPVALDLFDRSVNPTIVFTAVRVENWALAGTFVDRYAASEPDSIESQRLRAWVDSRRGNPDPFCVDPPRRVAIGQAAQP